MELASKHNVLAVSLTAILLVSGIPQWHGIGLNNATSIAEPLTAMSSEQQQQQHNSNNRRKTLTTKHRKKI
jgi:hypothetical protein